MQLSWPLYLQSNTLFLGTVHLNSYLSKGMQLCKLTESCDNALQWMSMSMFVVSVFCVILTIFLAGSIAFKLFTFTWDLAIFSLTYFLQVTLSHCYCYNLDNVISTFIMCDSDSFKRLLMHMLKLFDSSMLS